MTREPLSDVVTASMVTVRTKSFVLAQAVAERAVSLRAIAGFFGDPGTGKTRAARHFSVHCPADVDDHEKSRSAINRIRALS
ncbi:MAG: hypothetical protein ACRDWE_00280 [Acidimicrobiales bacterium]